MTSTNENNEFTRGSLVRGLAGISFIVVTYIYFLIFAQFAFLKRLAEFGIAGTDLKLIMGAMAIGGILVSLFAYRLEGVWPEQRRLQTAFLGCALGAAFSLVKLNLVCGVGVACLIGSSVGLLTVTLVTHLRFWIGRQYPLLKIGLGTGLAYLACNVPAFFTASPTVQAIASALLCPLGIALAEAKIEVPNQRDDPIRFGTAPTFWFAVACFTALVWLDSAAFYIIQTTPALKSGTWEGIHRLWLIGGIHLGAALTCAVLLQRFGLLTTLSVAFLLLGGACLFLASPSRAPIAAELYPFGVSLYSVALVAYPSFFAHMTDDRRRARLAGILYAVSGWFGSGMGIGMGENLRRVSPEFVVGAALLFVAPLAWKVLRTRKFEANATASLLLVAWGLHVLVESPNLRAISSVELGRQVFISEGCMNCHSQYVRPGTADELMWGPVANSTGALAESPPLIGNRRQGPDLSQVGNYRSALWLKAHFINPSQVSHHSVMPSYAYLFSDARGPALITYLKSLGKADRADHYLAASEWEPSSTGQELAPVFNGAKLYEQSCATCHSPDGETRLAWKREFEELPPDLINGPHEFVPAKATPEWRKRRIAEIIKFGLPGTDMPGHEYLSDAAIAAMAQYLVNMTPPITK